MDTCQYLKEIPIPGILQTHPPSLLTAAKQLGFTHTHAVVLAKWLAEQAIPTLLGDEPPLPGPDLVIISENGELGLEFLEWLSPPGSNDIGGAWIGEYRGDIAPTIEVEVRCANGHSDANADIPVITLSQFWKPTASRDTFWGFALAHYRAALAN